MDFAVIVKIHVLQQTFRPESNSLECFLNWNTLNIMNLSFIWAV